MDKTLSKLDFTLGETAILNIFHQLRVGVLLIDEYGRVQFSNFFAQRLIDKELDTLLNRPWEEVLPFHKQYLSLLRTMSETHADNRKRVIAHFEAYEKGYYTIEIDIHDYQADPKKKLFFLYDISELRSLRDILDDKVKFQDLIGKSESMQQVFQQIRELSTSDSAIIIEGEGGSGKELIARAIHYYSNRKDKPFIVIDCEDSSDYQLAGRLFGHRKGVYKEALDECKGGFELANGGTIFINNISKIPMNLQNILVRVLESKEIIPFGHSDPKTIDVRVISASPCDLNEEVRNWNFRSDLISKLDVNKVKVPPLRARRDDIVYLVTKFIKKLCASTGKNIQEMDSSAMRILLEYHWPDNVRELRNVMEYAVVNCQKTIIYPDDLPSEMGGISFETIESVPKESDSKDEKDQLLEVLNQAGGNRAAAARLMGISRATFYRRLAKFDIQ